MFILLLMCLALGGCGNYAEFTLPVLRGASDLQLRIELYPEPVIARSGEHDLLNPSVVRIGASYANLYSEFDGNRWHTAIAVSDDGRQWSKKGRVLSPDPRTWEGDYIAANGSVLWENGAWWYWYQAGDRSVPRIGLATSRDGRAWRKEMNPVLEPGPRGSWDERGVADPYVLKLSNFLYLYYLGQNRARQQQIGLARSVDGVHWTKLRSNPVLTIPWPGSRTGDENGLGEPAVWKAHGWYWIVYTGRNTSEERSLFLARSSDGVHWERAEAIHGDQAWDRAVVCDVTVLSDGDRIRLWFGGGDQPKPDENLDGQIGEGQATPVRVQTQ